MGFAVTHVDLVEPDGFVVSRPWNIEVKVGDYLLARTYRIDPEQTPVMIVTEWFLTNPGQSGAGWPLLPGFWC